MSNALAIFSCDLGATAMSYLKFSNWIYYSIFDSFANPYQFVLLNIEACPFEDIYCDEKNFVWHPLFFFFFPYDCRGVSITSCRHHFLFLIF